MESVALMELVLIGLAFGAISLLVLDYVLISTQFYGGFFFGKITIAERGPPGGPPPGPPGGGGGGPPGLSGGG
jgi:hypothetical protein